MAGEIGPGPSYLLPPTIGFARHDIRKVRMPEYTFGQRIDIPNKHNTPGPGLNVQNLTRYGKARVYAYTMAPRTFAKGEQGTGPGPANYDLNKSPYVSSRTPPSYTFGQRNKYVFKNDSPGPNAHGIRDNFVKQTPPSFSMGIRTTMINKNISPGPANYNPGKLSVTLPAAPHYSLSPRSYYSPKTIGPGAANYNRMNFKPGKSAPAYSFGVRHSPRSGAMIVPCDNM